jgi:phosphoenolpyruvate carboxykinase (GTP)
VYNDIEGIKTPTGFIPKYQDLKRLFNETLKKQYSEKEYIKQFTLRIPENLEKIDRLFEIYTLRVSDTPKIVFKILEEQKNRLILLQRRYGDYIPPDFSIFENFIFHQIFQFSKIPNNL